MPDFHFNYFLLDFVHSILIIGGISSVWIIIEQFRMKEKLNNVERKQTLDSLKYLKAQTNPHFLFNVLNNINFLIENNPEKASETLFKLSDMLRYQLYDADIEEVEIEKEIKHFKNYIELEEIRIGDRLDLKVDIKCEDNNVKIPPFLFLPLIENAFKYSSSVDGGFINLKLKITSVSVNLIIENSILKKEGVQSSGGLGLENLNQRLELLYPKKHQLRYGNKGENFEVILFINL
jgi:LytS/YehU family sensor histidine kinase